MATMQDGLGFEEVVTTSGVGLPNQSQYLTGSLLAAGDISGANLYAGTALESPTLSGTNVYAKTAIHGDTLRAE